jgi:hypothetical protein
MSRPSACHESLSLPINDVCERNIEELGIDLIINEILSRVPAKLVVMAMCVCKLWCSMLESRVFIVLHSTCTKNA